MKVRRSYIYQNEINKVCPNGIPNNDHEQKIIKENNSPLTNSRKISRNSGVSYTAYIMSYEILTEIKSMSRYTTKMIR
jgi:hypothetical protein